MYAHRAHRLVTLGDTTLVFARPAQDIRGRKVVDAVNGSVGFVYGFYLDEFARRIKFLAVRKDDSPETATVVIPADAVRLITPDRVLVDGRADGPAYDPTLVEREVPGRTLPPI